jgi:hypothetical protein
VFRKGTLTEDRHSGGRLTHRTGYDLQRKRAATGVAFNLPARVGHFFGISL